MTTYEKAMISFCVTCLPIAQPRQRHRVIGDGAKRCVHNYTPTQHPVNAFKASVRMAAAAAYHGPPLEGPLAIALLFLMPRPKAKIWKTRPMPREPYTGKYDWDNLAKGFCDALNGVLWRDDHQIAEALVRVYVAAGDESPRVDCVVAECVEQVAKRLEELHDGKTYE
jgi:Holliday junction resolvase RusA-like endonuclease